MERDSIPLASLSHRLEHDEITTATLEQICRETGWEYCERWIPIPGSAILTLHPLGYIHPQLDSDRHLAWQQFRACSAEFILSSGEGLPGRVWASQAPEWIEDVAAQSETYFLRHLIAKAFSVGTGLGIPFFTNDGIHAVLALFTSQKLTRDQQVIDQVQAILQTVMD